ncbi:MAG: 2'-5' RNA ligase family protein [Phycisphaerales bacterium]|nr:MAG: 2'-5' RNA ligase family protein [Phycisphaerales bacterium]
MTCSPSFNALAGEALAAHNGDMAEKTHQTAVVLIPPQEVWEPIQAIRRVHDRQVRRWMPHVTLLYPFVPREAFDAAEARLRQALADLEPFDVRLKEFHYFHHGRGRHTLWLAPEPAEAMRRLQASLQSAVPECNDVSRRGDGFTPHLSVGQVTGRDDMLALKDGLQGSWSAMDGLTFTAKHVSMIWRDPKPDDVFRVDREIPLGGKT